LISQFGDEEQTAISVSSFFTEEMNIEISAFLLLLGWISDAIGRKYVFVIMFITQSILYFILPQISNQILFTVAACYLLACYGGGFATMPAFAADSFGPGYIGKVYGIMLTAWGAAGVIGPYVFAQMKGISLFVAAGLLALGFLIALAYQRPKSKNEIKEPKISSEASK